LGEFTQRRRAELVEEILAIYHHPSLLKSSKYPSEKISRSGWSYVDQFLRLLEKHFTEEQKAKQKLQEWLQALGKKRFEQPLNDEDLQKMKSFLLRPEFQSLSIRDMRFVIGWLYRLTEESRKNG